MQDNKTNRDKLYTYLTNKGVTGIGANRDEFETIFEDEEKQKKLYDFCVGKGYTGIGKDYDEFAGGFSVQQPANAYEGMKNLAADSESAVAPIDTVLPTENRNQDIFAGREAMARYADSSQNLRKAEAAYNMNPTAENAEQLDSAAMDFSVVETSRLNAEKEKRTKEELLAERKRLEDAKKEVELRLRTRRGEITSPSGMYQMGMAPVTGNQAAEITDPEMTKLYAAVNSYDNAIRSVDRKLSGEDPGFWEGVADATVRNPGFYTMGLTDMSDARGMLNIAQNGVKEKEDELLADALYSKNAEQQDEDFGFLYRAGNMFGHSVPFMVQAAVTGGFSGASRAGANLAGRLGKKAAEGTIKKKIINAMGTTIDDVIEAGLIANTAGAGGTWANIAERKAGKINIKDGDYVFENGESWLGALYKGEVSSILELYTEKLGGHFEGKLSLTKGLDKIGASRVSNVLLAAKNSDLYKGASTVMRQFGLNGYLPEVLEEEANLVLNSLLVGDNSLSELYNPKTQLDIFGGMLLTVGTMQVIPGTIATAGYVKNQYQMNRADRRAADVFGEDWGAIKEALDNATNEKVAGIVAENLREDENHNKALLDYYKRMMIMRGYNIGTVKNETAPEIEEAYTDGFSQEPTGANALNAMTGYDMARQEVARALGLAEGDDVDVFLNGRTAEDIAKGDTDVENAVKNYQQQKARMEGIQEKFQQTREQQYEESDRSIQANDNNGMVYATQLKDEPVFITGGNVVLNEDGTIDVDNSSETLYVKFPDGHVEMTSPDKFTEVFTSDRTADLKAAKRAEIDAKWKAEFDTAEAQSVEQEKREAGVVFNMTDAQGEHRIEILNEGEDMSNILLDGAQMEIPTEELNRWKQEAGTQSTENGVQSADAVADDTTDNVAPTGDNVAPVTPVDPKQRKAEVLSRIPMKGKQRMWTEANPADVAEYISLLTEDPAKRMAVIDGYIAKVQEAQAKAEPIEALEMDEQIAFWNGIKEMLAPQEAASQSEKTAASESVASQTETAEHPSVAAANEGRDTVGGSPVALAYLLEGGQGSILNAGYFLHGVAAAFPAVSNEIETLRGAMSEDVLGMSPTDFVAQRADEIAQIGELITNAYGEAGAAIYNELLNNASGFVPRVGAEVGARIEALQPLGEPVGNSDQLSSSEIPNSQSVAEGDAPGQSGVYADNQGNPVDADGKLIVDEVNSIDEITDEDFETPTRNVQLPAIPENVANAIGANGRPVVIKKNVFEKNGNTHVELEPEDSRNILRSALYNPNLVGSTQPIRRPDYKVAIRTGEQNAVVVLDVYQEKDFVEIVGWRMVNEKGLAKMQRQAEREGGQFLILSPNDGSAAALSALPLGLSSASEDRNSVSNSQENVQESGEIAENGGENAKSPMQELADQILDRAEEKRRIPLRERAKELEAQVGVKANIIESVDEVADPEARRRIIAGQNVAGWYSKGEVYLYMPNIKDRREIELTYVHEVVAHHGVKKLLGKRFNEFLDGVWNMMSEADRARMLAYVGANENPTLQDMRAAADEYVAELAEKMDLNELERSTWDKIVDWFKELLENIGFENLTKEDIENMLKASYSNLRAESGKGETGSTENDFRAKMTFHGSGAKFDRFDHAFMGTGEGAQAFGWGTYVTEVEGIGKQYANATSKPNLTYKGQEVDVEGYENPWRLINDLYEDTRGKLSEMRAKAERYEGLTEEDSLMKPVWKEVVKILKEARRGDLKASPRRVLYTVEIPDDNGSNYLHWEEVVPSNVVNAVKQRLFDELAKGDYKGAEKELKRELDDVFKYSDNEGYSLYGNISAYLGGGKAASRFLNEMGFVGISYPADGGRAGNKKNYVIFNENDAQIKDRTMFRISRTPQEFDATQAEAVEKRGIVAPELNEAVVNVVDVPRHDFTGRGIDAIHKAEEWANKNIAKEHTYHEGQEDEFKYTIDDDTISKFLSKSSTGNSDNLGVHLAALKELPNIINNSIDVEVHPDYQKKDGARSAENGVGRNDMLVHRMYGAVSIDGKVYRAKTTIHELRDKENKAYDYKITEIELIVSGSSTSNARTNSTSANGTLIEDSTVTPNDGINNPLNRSVNSISATKLLEGVEKSYDKGKKVLEESEKSSEQQVNPQDSESGIRFRKVEDPAKIAELEAGEKMKVYRAMQVIDGKLYPPMSAKVDGKLREPTELGVWEEAEERPELADDKGYFKLDKGNKKSLKARYNPYIHTSTTPLNDQFSEAQERPNLVTVEVEIPVSELTSGYKAEKAKDAVGRLEWKAGVVQGKLSGTRTVILSRWDKPVRIVPDSEVADVIVEMFGDREIVMPSNVVTPSLRAELEKRGVPFVETNNQGKPVSAKPMTKEEARQMVRELIVPFAKELREEQEKKLRASTEDSGTRFRIANENQEIFVSNAQRAVEGIQQNKATAEQWIAMLKKNGGLKAGEDAWLGLEEWLNEKQGAVTKQEILDYIAQNRIQIEEVNYTQFGYGLMDEATRKLEAELKEIGWDAMVEKYPGFDELFEVYEGELLWSEERASVGEYEDFIIDNKIIDLDSQSNAINETREKYTTDGLERKREIALTVPTIEPYNESDEVHFGDAGNGRAVAWVRFGETTDSEGNRVLVIDEIQSKRHQDGREKGYRSNADKFLKDNGIEVVETDTHFEFYKNGEVDKRFAKDLFNSDIEKAKNLYVAGYEKTAVPSAPFEKNWHELAMKRMLRLAAEEGFDKVAWTTGEQQAERYNLGAVLKGLKAYKTSANEYYVIPYNNGAIGEFVKEYTEQELADTFGKELAQKIIANAENATEENPYEIEGEELRVGGEGMKGFYDRMLPSFVQKYTKKWGAKVGEVTMPNLRENNTMWSVDVTPEMQESVMQGQTMFRKKEKEENIVEESNKNVSLYRTEDGKVLRYEQLDLFDNERTESDIQRGAAGGTETADNRPGTGGVQREDATGRDIDSLNIPLRPLEKGEVSRVQRVFTKSKAFDFTAGERIESLEDVAYIFKNLEDESVENTFAVLVKDGRPIILHLGMGHYTASMVNLSAISVAARNMNPDKIYFVHNHPSGALKASTNDLSIWNALKEAYGDIVEKGIIINLKSGKFGVFDQAESEVRPVKEGNDADIPVELFAFNKQVFDKDYNPEELYQAKSQEDVAAFISSNRLGERSKVGVLVCNPQLRVVGNVFTPFTGITSAGAKKVAEEVVYYTTIMGGTRPILFGNFPALSRTAKSLLEQYISIYSGGSIKMADIVDIKSGESVINEPEETYGGEERVNEGTEGNNRTVVRETIGNGDVETLSEGARTEAEGGTETEDARFRTVEDVIEQQQENEVSLAREAATSLGEKLNTPVKIMDNLDSVSENRRKWKGWFDPKTGEVVVVMPNHVSTDDAVQTVLHEVVAHKGLRAVLGEDFDGFLDGVYKNASPKVKRGINDKFLNALRNGPALTVREATEEYIAELAERDFEGYRDTWNAIRQWFRNFFRNFMNMEITDGELRYLLWKNYNRMKNGPVEAILDRAMEANTGTGKVMARTAETYSAVDAYNKSVKGFRNKFKEGWYDEMRSLKKAQEAIEKELGREIMDSENVYLYANHIPSINKNKKEVFDNKYLRPFTSLLEQLYGKEVNGKKLDEKSLERYTNAKHGIERNREMSVKNALTEVQDGKKVFNEKAYKSWAQERDEVREKNLPWADEQRELDKVAEKYGAKIRDYSGLTAIFDTEKKLRYKKIADAAYQYVADVEKALGDDVNKLWGLLKGMTDYSLNEAFESGMMSKSTYEHIKQMYRYYVPLRGFTEQTAEDFFDYVEGDHSPLNAVVKTAYGRKSEADNIFATILNMANSAIVQGSKNRLKQRLLNLAMRSQTGLLSVDNAWYAKNGDTFTPVEYPENANEYADFEERMKELEKNGEVVRHRPGLEIGRKVAQKWNETQHAVRVKRNGREYVVWVNGDPTMANAINGLLREEIGGAIKTVNQFRSKMVTQYSPTFVFTNLLRDVQSASIIYAVRRGTTMLKEFEKNVASNATEMMDLYLKHKRGTLDVNNPKERYFKEFLENGGETGYTEMISIEEYEKKLKELTTGLNMKNATGRAFEAVGGAVDFANRCIENLCRFSAYQTSREAGISILKSIEDAKEVSVNFNRKGSGAMGQKYAKAGFMFLNPAVQSIAQRILLTKKYPKKMAAVWAGEFILGAAIPVLYSIISAALGDDDDEITGNYYNLSDYRRRSSLCLPAKDGVFHIPLSHESRVLFGLGELCTSVVMGHEKLEDAPIEALNTLAQSLPLNPVEGWMPGKNIIETMTYNFMPDAVKPIAEVVMNRDFAGNTIHNRTDFNEFMPEYMRGKRGTLGAYKKISKYLTSTDGYEKSFLNDTFGALFNPSVMEHLVEGYLGGLYTFGEKALKAGAWAFGNEEYAEFRNIPIASSFYTSLAKYEDTPKEERARRDWENAFRFYKDEVKGYDDKEKTAKNAMKYGEEDAYLVLEQMERNGEVLMVDIFNDGNDRLKELYGASDAARKNRDFKRVEDIDQQIYAEKRNIVSQMEQLAEDPMIGYTFRRNKIEGPYGERETYGDVRDEKIIDDMQKELKPYKDGHNGTEAYGRSFKRHLDLYEDLNDKKDYISDQKRYMKNYPGEADECMNNIREKRAEAIKLINNYRKDE